MNARRLLPLAPVAAGLVALLVVLGGGDDEPDAVAVTSSAADVASLDALVEASDLVVVGTVTDVAEGRRITAPGDPAAGLRTRLLILDVTAVLLGDTGDQVIVEEAATLADGTPVEVDGVAPVAAGTEAVWFLVTGDADTMPYYALVNRQGRYVVEGDVLRAAVDEPLSERLAALGRDGLTDAVGERR